MKKILLIGCGHMGSALLTSWVNSKKYSLFVIDPINYKYLENKYKNKKINFFKSITSLKNLQNYNYIILAVKPINLDEVLDELSNFKIKNNTTLISVIAGKKINIFEKKFINIKNIFRVMPNIPALIGESMNCIVSNKKASIIKKNEVVKLFNYSGKSIILQNENQIDMATAISGSGPGFIYNLMDAMEKAATKLGLSSDIARTLVIQTFKGSTDLILKNNLTAKKLVKSVATKGGTTEAGLKVMNKYKVHKIFIELTNSAYKKAKYQGKINAKK